LPIEGSAKSYCFSAFPAHLRISQRLNLNQEEFRTVGKMVPEAADGERIDGYLGRSFPFFSRTIWKNKIKTGELLVNGSSVKPTYNVRWKDKLTTFYPEYMEPEVPTNISEIWSEQGVMAVYKPSGLPMHEVGKYRKNTFSNLLIEKYGEQWAAVHRIDAETSGIVLCADSYEGRKKLSEDFIEHNISKEYLAIMIGRPKKDEWHVNVAIGEMEDTLLRKKMGAVEGAASAFTTFKVVERTGYHALVKAFPESGRTHQIRIHAAYCGHRLLGEKKHLEDETVFMEFCDQGITQRVLKACGAERLCLHAHALNFTHPITGKAIRVESPMDVSMANEWNRLKFTR
jgi:23S rRNA pseudouridine1911/1915/1917 synthase